MRDIKFRDKSIKGNKWIYGAYIPAMDEDSLDSIIDANNGEWRLVRSATVGQFTGLRDKNDREIWEGDVVSVEICDSENVGVVDWADAYAEFRIDNEYTYFNESLGDIVSGSNSCLSIIGNIHDNPELLKTLYHIDKFLKAYDNE